MSFFVTSRGTGNWGNLGGLAGADAFCASLATAVSPLLGAKVWRAYLSTSTVNARDRIGAGPWRNARGRIIANSLAQLHDQGVGGTLDTTWPVSDADVALDERGARVPTLGMGSPELRKDVYTGSNLDGTSGPTHCNDWTSAGTGGTGIKSADDVRLGQTVVGYSDRSGPTSNRSWNSVGTVHCGAGQTPFAPRGVFYCFAVP